MEVEVVTRRTRQWLASAAFAVAMAIVLGALLINSERSSAQADDEPRFGNGAIYFVSDRGGDPDLYTLKGVKDPQRLLERPLAQRSPAIFDPDGTLLFSEQLSPQRSDVYRSEPQFRRGQREPERKVSKLTSTRSLNLDPELLDSGFLSLYSTDRDGDFELRVGLPEFFGQLPPEFRRDFIDRGLRLGPGGLKLTDNDAADTEPSAAARLGRRDTTKIAFTSNREGNEDIWLLEADRGERTERQVTASPAADSAPSISVDGSTIAFASDRDGGSEIFLIDAGGSNLRQLTDNPATETDPEFSPDGSRVAFSSDRDGNQEIYAIDIDGSNERRITDDPGADTEPSWATKGFGGKCFNAQVFERVAGTPQPDALIGSAANDRVKAAGGRDLVRGRAGDDCVFGGGAGDVLYGNGGRDNVYGGGGFDRLHGGMDRDSLLGGDSADKLRGGQGPDQLTGGRGNDLLFGGRERDFLFGSLGADVVKGGSGDDFIIASRGRDRINCGRGRDTVFAGQGKPAAIAGNCERVERRGKIIFAAKQFLATAP